MNDLTMNEAGVEQPIREQKWNKSLTSLQLSRQWRYSTFLKKFASRVSCYAREKFSSSDCTLALTSVVSDSGRDSALCRRPVTLTEENQWFLWLVLVPTKQPQITLCLQRCFCLHFCVGFAADISWNHHREARPEAGQNRNQVDLAPYGPVIRPKACKFRSQRCQGQIQDGPSDFWVFNECNVSLKWKGCRL